MSEATVHPTRPAQKKKRRRRRRRSKIQRVIDDLTGSIVRTMEETKDRREEQAGVRTVVVTVVATLTFSLE